MTITDSLPAFAAPAGDAATATLDAKLTGTATDAGATGTATPTGFAALLATPAFVPPPLLAGGAMPRLSLAGLVSPMPAMPVMAAMANAASPTAPTATTTPAITVETPVEPVLPAGAMATAPAPTGLVATQAAPTPVPAPAPDAQPPAPAAPRMAGDNAETPATVDAAPVVLAPPRPTPEPARTVAKAMTSMTSPPVTTPTPAAVNPAADPGQPATPPTVPEVTAKDPKAARKTPSTREPRDATSDPQVATLPLPTATPAPPVAVVPIDMPRAAVAGEAPHPTVAGDAPPSATAPLASTGPMTPAAEEKTVTTAVDVKVERSVHAEAAPTGAAETRPATSGGFADAVAGATPQVTAPAVTPAAAAPAAQPVVTAQAGRIGHELGIAVARHVTTDGGEALTVRLNPQDMGRITARLSFDEQGTLRLVVAADHPAALEMLRRDSGDLHRALTDAGLPLDAQTLRFDTRTDSQDARDPRGWQQQPSSQPETQTGAVDPDDTIDEPALYRPMRADGRVDLMA